MVCLKAASFLVGMYLAAAIIALHLVKHILERINEEATNTIRRIGTGTWSQAARLPFQDVPHGACNKIAPSKQTELVPFF